MNSWFSFWQNLFNLDRWQDYHHTRNIGHGSQDTQRRHLRHRMSHGYRTHSRM